MMCRGCGQRAPAVNSDYCLACLTAGADRPQTPHLVNQDDAPIHNGLATNTALGRRLCIECGAPVKPVNLFGGGSFYRCTSEKCGHEDKETRDSTPWPRMTPEELQAKHPTTRRN